MKAWLCDRSFTALHHRISATDISAYVPISEKIHFGTAVQHIFKSYTITRDFSPGTHRPPVNGRGCSSVHAWLLRLLRFHLRARRGSFPDGSALPRAAGNSLRASPNPSNAQHRRWHRSCAGTIPAAPAPSQQDRIPESQHGGGWQGPLWVPQPNPLPKQGHPEQGAQHRGQAGLEYLQRRRLPSLPGQPGPGLRHPQREEVLPRVQSNGNLRPLPLLQVSQLCLVFK